MRRVNLSAFFVVLLLPLSADAGTDLPIVEDVEFAPLRDHCRQLLKALAKAKSSLPDETVRAVQAIVEKEPADASTAARAVQKLLDAHCLLAVSINPESRVKAARGPAAIELRKDRETIVLVKVHNDGGVTHSLGLRGPQLIAPGQPREGRWLRAALVTEAPFGSKLSGRRLEYRLLRLTPRESGRREAVFQFDVGQGTQDLGFRAEVPVLFTVPE